METVDGLFFSHFDVIDVWHNDFASGAERRPALSAAKREEDQSLLARTARQAPAIDGELYDLPRFFAWAAHGSTERFREHDAYTTTHLSGSYYRSLGLRHGFDVRHVNQADRVSVMRLAEIYRPRYLFVSTTFMTEPAIVMEAVHALRHAFPGVSLVLGGLVLVELERGLDAATFQRFLRAWRADAYVVSAQGEEAFLEILRHEPGELAALDPPSTWVRRAGGYVKSERHEHGLSLDQDYVRWSLFEPRALYHAVHTRTARSCAFACAFCSYPANQGALTLSSADTLRAELGELRRQGSVRSVVFVDDTFNVPPLRFKELLRVLLEFDFEWYSFFRMQYADRETATMMADSGCRGVFLGIESLDDRVLKNMHKAVNERAYRRGMAELKRAGIASHANFILGFPGDRPENARKIADFVDEFEVEFLCATPFYMSPATPISGEREKYGFQGNFWHWKHDTMTSEEAFEQELWLMQAPKRSVFMSELSARSFWTELLHYANGWTPAELQEAARVFNSFAGRDTPAAVLRASPEVARLRALLARHPMAAPPDAALLGAEAAVALG